MKIQITCDFSKVDPKLFHVDRLIEKELNDHFDTRDYGPGVTVITFVYKVFPDFMLDDHIRSDAGRYRSKRREVLVNPRIKHEVFTTSNDQERTRFIAVALFEELARKMAIYRIRNFETNLFLGDLELFLKHKDWID